MRKISMSDLSDTTIKILESQSSLKNTKERERIKDEQRSEKGARGR